MTRSIHLIRRNPALFIVAAFVVVTLALLGARFSLPADAETAIEEAILTDSNGQGGDMFGIGATIATTQDMVILGAPGDDDDGAISGSVFVFKDSPSGWVQYQKLTASDASALDRFGSSISVTGDALVVGARADGQGSAYVFRWDGLQWNEQQKLTPSSPTTEMFGSTVATAAGTIVVGAPGDYEQGTRAGAFFVFTENAGVWTQTQRIIPTTTGTFQMFGGALAMDGQTIVAGSINGTFLYENVAGSWTLVQQISGAPHLISASCCTGSFSQGLAMDGDQIAVGRKSGSNGYVSIYTKGVSGWAYESSVYQPDGAAGDWFGGSMAINGNVIVAGAYGHDSEGDFAGAAYLYIKTSAGWTFNQKITASDARGRDLFGSAVGLSGERLVIGADGQGLLNHNGKAYVFSVAVAPPQPPPTITDPSEPTTYYSSTVRVEGTCVDDEISVEWFFETWGMPWSLTTHPCESGIWSADTPYPLQEGDYTLKACNAGTAECAEESVTIEMPPYPLPTITDPSEPTIYSALPVHAEGTCGGAITIDWFNELDISIGGSSSACTSGTWSADNNLLDAGAYTLTVCNTGTAYCVEENVTMDLGGPPEVEDAKQFKANGSMEIEEGDTTDENTVVFKANVQNEGGDHVRWQIELREVGEGFLNTYDSMDGGFLQTDPVTATTPTPVEIIRPSLENGDYHWQYRAYVDATETASDWTRYETDDSNADFIVEVAQQIKVAVILAETKNADMASNTKDRILNDDPTAIDDMDSLLRNYFCENSFGDYSYDPVTEIESCIGSLINISLEIIDNNGQPFELNEGIDHYGENTFLDLNYTISVGTDGNGKDIEIKSNDHTAELIWEAINKADALNPSPDFNSFDIVVVVYEGDSESALDSGRPKTFAWPVHFSPSASPNELAVNWIPMAETWNVGVWAHEIAHIMGEINADKYLCDLYPYTHRPKLGCSVNINEWDLMGGKGPHLGDGLHPSNLSSYSLVELGWLENITDLLPGSFTVTGLADMKYLDEVETVSIDDDTYYIVEARKKSVESVWDSEIPEDEALVIYRVRNDMRREVVYPEQVKQDVDRDTVWFEEALTFDGDSYVDEKNDIAIIADAFNSGAVFTVLARYETDTDTVSRQLGFIDPDNQHIQGIEYDSGPIGVPPVDPSELEPSTTELIAHAFLSSVTLQEDGRYGWFLYFALLLAAVLIYLIRTDRLEKWSANKGINIKRVLLVVIALSMLGHGYFLIDHVKRYPLSAEDAFFKAGHERLAPVSGPSPLEIADPDEDVLLPDLDLHAYDDQGNHVGMNYITGEYENQIPGANTTGDRPYDEEWISVPEGTNVHFEVSTHDIEQFFAENPDIAASLASLEESYTFGAVTYDAVSNRAEATPVENIVINPGETRIHTIGGTTEAPTVDEGVVVVELDVIGDSYLKKGHPNKNFGDEAVTRIQGSGNNSPLVMFDQQAIEDAVGTGTLVSATLEMATIDGTAGSWTSNGKLVGTYRLTHPWTELGATWNCHDDTDTSNGGTDCTAETWEMNQNQGPSWEVSPSDEVLFTNDTTGTVTWDVISDVSAFLAGTSNYGWIVRKDQDGSQGQIEFESRETIAQPRLILRFNK